MKTLIKLIIAAVLVNAAYKGGSVFLKYYQFKDETQQMIHLAHASALHWQAVGTAVNRQRGENLLATVYAAAGDAAAAVRHAERCLSLSVQNAKDESPFDRATALGCAAKAHALAGDTAQADRLRTLAKTAASALVDEERGVFEKLYG